MKKENIIKELMIIFWLFIVGSILGCMLESVVVILQKGHYEPRKGLIYGPFIPVYGIGIVIYYFLLKNVDTRNKIKVFLITMLFGGIIEYLCSFFQEKLFGTVSWDYSNLWFNINGRTSLLHCTYWGIAGVIYAVCIKPLTEEAKAKTISKSAKFITVIMFCFMIFNIGISCMAANRQKERRNNIMPVDGMDVFLDTHYPDEYMDNVYVNKKERI